MNQRCNCFNFLKVTCLILCLTVTLARPASAQSRITGAIRTSDRIAVQGSHPNRLLANSVETGRVSGSQKLGRMVLLLTPTDAQQAAAAALVAAQQDPTSPSYHQWLTPAQFGEQFGVADADTAQVGQWLQGQGLTVHQISQSRRFIVFSGNVAQVEGAFSTEMHTYTYKGKSFISNSTDIQIPVALRSVVHGVVRLHSAPAAPALVGGKQVHFKKAGGQFTFDVGEYGMTPADFAKIYNIQPLYDAGINGTGQTIAIVGRSNIDPLDVTQFRALLGLPANDPQIIINGDDPGINADQAEATLDVTWSGAVAPMAHIDFVVSQSNFADGVDVSAEYIVDNNLAPVMSTSYGECESVLGPVENAFYNSLWQQAAAQGITSFVAAGDNGGAGCDAPGGGQYAFDGLAVNGIASTPYDVAVGGTQFDDTDNPTLYWSATNDPVTGESALSYIPEMVWNESSNDPNAVSLYAGSGGVSTLYTKPNWQIGAGVPADGMRDLPDISFSAAGHDGYLLCLQENCSYGDYFYQFGGTSASSPAAAGVMALINQKMNGKPQGIANDVFYRLASVPGVYHDTIKGNNMVPDGNGQYTVGYNAAPGYDLATGLGSIDVKALVNHWQAAANGKSTATTLALTHGEGSTVIHGSPIQLRATVTCTTNGNCTTPTGSIAVSAASTTASTVGVGSATLTTVSGAGQATVKTSEVPGGLYNITARYSGDGVNSPSTSAAIPVTVKPETSQTYVGAISGGAFATAPIGVGYGLTLPLAIVVAGNSGAGFPSGNMTLTADGTPITNGGVYNYSSGVYAPSALLLNYGERSSLITGLSSSQASTISYVLPSQALGVGLHHLVASYPGDPSFAPSQGDYAFNVTPAQGVIEDFFPAGSLVVNAPVKLVAQVGFASLGFAPYGGLITISDITSGKPVVLGKSAVDSTLYGGYWSQIVTITTPGTHTLRLDYAGDANVKGTIATYSVPFPATADSYVSFATDVTNTFAGQPVTLTANVGSDIQLHVATGKITFTNGSASLGSVKLDATGTAVLVTTGLGAGIDNLTATYSGDTVLNPSQAGPVPVDVADYVVQLIPGAVTVAGGQAGTAVLNLIPLGGFASKIKLACSGQPTTVNCSFSKSSVTLDGTNPAAITVTLTSRGNLASLAPNRKPNPWGVTTAISLGGLLLLLTRRRSHFRDSLATLCLVGFLFGAIGCSNPAQSTTSAESDPNNNNSSKTYAVTITTTSVTGTTPKTTALTLTVSN